MTSFKLSFIHMLLGYMIWAAIFSGWCGRSDRNDGLDANTNADTDTDTAADSDSDTDADSDTDSDADTDADTDSGHQTAAGIASCEGLVIDTARHSMTALDKPGRQQAVTDPEFGTRIVRITDVANETGGAVIKPMYSTVQAWNADETLLLLYDVGGGHRLYNGQTYGFIQALQINPPDLEQVYFSPVDGDILYFAEGNRLIEFSISKNSGVPIHTFSACDSVSAGDDPMYISWDGQSFGFLCSGGRQGFVYHLDSDSESTYVNASDIGPQVAPSGEAVYLAGDVYDGNMNFIRTLNLENPYDHASLGQLANGRDTLNMVVFDGRATGTLVTFDLLLGDATVIVGEQTGYPYPPAGTHISAVAHKAPGWVAVSVVGNDCDGQDVLDNELLLANTNTGDVCRIAHHRSYGKNGPQGYWAEPHAVISPTGTRVLFASDWGGGQSVDTYVVELPAYASGRSNQ
ncbi:MAG: hypothetical protein JXX14_13345 [Deltaproteobacteria bacterium]|nr:hypothetical protein [Deltaproteobacteria bacterium]